MKIETTTQFDRWVTQYKLFIQMEAKLIAGDDGLDMYQPHEVEYKDFQREVAEAINSMARDMMDE